MNLSLCAREKLVTAIGYMHACNRELRIVYKIVLSASKYVVIMHEKVYHVFALFGTSGVGEGVFSQGVGFLLSRG